MFKVLRVLTKSAVQALRLYSDYAQSPKSPLDFIPISKKPCTLSCCSGKYIIKNRSLSKGELNQLSCTMNVINQLFETTANFLLNHRTNSQETVTICQIKFKYIYIYIYLFYVGDFIGQCCFTLFQTALYTNSSYTAHIHLFLNGHNDLFFFIIKCGLIKLISSVQVFLASKTTILFQVLF